jgi:hypothetical protein
VTSEAGTHTKIRRRRRRLTVKRILQRLSVRKCRDEVCRNEDNNWHTHHLTWIGRLRFTSLKGY